MCRLPLRFNYWKTDSNKFTKEFNDFLGSHHILLSDNMFYLHMTTSRTELPKKKYQNDFLTFLNHWLKILKFKKKIKNHMQVYPNTSCGFLASLK